MGRTEPKWHQIIAMDTKLVIAVVEDHDDLRGAMVDALSSQGHTVMAVADAEAFMEMAAATELDLVIVDLNLPGEDGISLTKRLRQAHPTLGIVIVSARGLVQEKTQGYESGADIYLTKPVALQELVAAVRALGHRVKTPEPAQLACLRFGQLELIGPTGDVVALPWHEAVLLRTLILASDHQVDYWQLMQAMGKNVDVYTKSALELVVVRLRKRMQSIGFESTSLRAVRNRGYMLLAPIELA
jgi:two-component system OmpR family response regulator